MTNDFKKNVFDSREAIISKSKKIETYLGIEKQNLINSEIQYLNNIVKKLSFILPREEFSCKHGILMYSFDHKESNREVYISPDVYLIDADCVVYEVINPDKYFSVTKNEILISRANKYFCEIPLSQFLEYVTPEDITNYLTKYINSDYEELSKLQKRHQFLSSPNKLI